MRSRNHNRDDSDGLWGQEEELVDFHEMDLEPEQTRGRSSFHVSTVFGQQAATSSTNCGESDLNRRPHTGDGLWKR